MICPQCKLDFNIPTDGEQPVHNCPACGGTWISGKSLHAMLAKSGDPTGIEDMLDSILRLDFRTSQRRCPGCVSRHLKAVVIEDTELDFCASCKGLFFDPGELQRVFPGILNQTRDSQETGVGGFWASLLKSIGHD